MNSQDPGRSQSSAQEISTQEQIKHLSNPGQSTAEAEINRAEEILNLIASAPNQEHAVNQHLEDILELLPAIISANIRQASLEGKAELVHSLSDLLVEFQPQFTDSAQNNLPHPDLEARPASDLPRLLFICPEHDATLARQQFISKALQSLRCETFSTSTFPLQSIQDFDVVLISRAHLNQEYLQGMALCRARNIPIILDIDLDYRTIPLKHPEYEQLSLKDRDTAQAYTTSLLLADQIISPSRELVNQLRSEGFTTFFTPPGWDGSNPLWNKSIPDRHTINIGWLGYPGQVEDIALVRRMLTRIVRQIPQTKLVIGANPQAYQLFKNIPDGRKLYLPPADPQDFPYSLSQVDILIAPLGKIPFNQSVTDRVVVEAGARGIPFIASPAPNLLEWGVGGLFAGNLDEWHSQLHQLVVNPELRKDLSEEGHKKALEREITQLAPIYLDLIDLIRWSKTSNKPKITQAPPPEKSQ